VPPRSFARPAGALAAVVLAGIALPLLTRDSYYLDVATTILMNLVLTMSLRFEISTGQLNMAHISFLGIGAYTSALLVGQAGWSFWITLWVAGLIAAVFAVPVGSLALRVTGPYYFLITFAFSEVIRLIFNNFFVGWFGGPSGLVQIPKPRGFALPGYQVTFDGKLDFYVLMLALFVLAAVVLVRLEYSRWGLTSNAIRQADLLAETLGVDVFRHKLAVFVVGSAMAGVAGAFFAHSHQVLHSSDFGNESMVLLVVFAVIGGTGSVWGPILGTVVLAVVGEFLRELHHYELMVFGGVLMVTMLLFPDGLVGLPVRLARARRGGRAGAGASRAGAGVAP
jgi:branched-chain amino acid transport system permease protein